MSELLIIGFDGIDGSGKTSIAKRLVADSVLKEKCVFTHCGSPPSPYVDKMYSILHTFKHSYDALNLLVAEQTEKNIGSLNTQFKFQRNSEIAREHGIQPDLVLIQPLGYRTIIEVVCYNIDREAKILVKERGIAGVDMVIAIVPNQLTKKTLQRAMDRCQTRESDAHLASLVILDAGQCLSPKFDWVSIFERP